MAEQDGTSESGAEESDFIGLPPGMTNFDSATYRMESPRRAEPSVAESAPVFVPTVVPGLPVSGLPAAAPSIGGEAPTAAPAASPAPASPALSEQADDATMVAPTRRAGGWVLEVGGESQRLVEGVILLGRGPAARPEWPSARLLAVIDPRKSVSKTHAAVEVDTAGALLVHDLDSTNGVWLSYPNGDESDVAPGTPHPVENGATIHLGEFEIMARRG